jgi:tripartite-type tricarboxylate transporter receptor subunit TctC
MLERRSVLSSLILATAWALSPTVSAQDFPNRPIRMIVAFTAGTGSDLLARNITPELARLLGQPVLVDNRAGGGGIVGTESGARAPADGYTVTVASQGAMIIVPAMNPSTPYRHERDFVPIGGLARSGYVVVTANTPEAPRTFQELVARVRSAAQPTNFSSPGVGTATHLAGEIIIRQAGMRGAHVPYKGSAQALGDVASGQVLFGFDTTGATLPLVRGGKLRALAVSSASRIASLSDVPTLSEAGLKDFSIDGWWGLFAPIATPKDVVAKLSENLVRALQDPEVRRRLAAQEVEPFPISSQELAALIAREEPAFVKLVKDADLVQKP